ncbi:hypothetical protein F2Q69_00044750 [Brassica cretica]|uniref:PB1 domain-containing protein n=1 Tax=Brassica cretica TaxID=69181 RepID=A0A8S9NJK0_BRACR|nr:hypothetical protein F2Q69_00044750 [Brassica cretica]
MTTVTEGAKAVTPRCTNSGRLRVMCRYGGSILSLPQTKSPRYVGGDTRIVAVPPSAETSVASLVSHLVVTLGISYDFKVKYQLPDQELDSLISVETDEDVQIMMEEHGYLTDPLIRNIKNERGAIVVVNFLMEENCFLTAFELLHELLDYGHDAQTIRLKEFFSDPSRFPPDQISWYNSIRDCACQ